MVITIAIAERSDNNNDDHNYNDDYDHGDNGAK